MDISYIASIYSVKPTATELTNTAYDIFKVLGKDADFLYDTIELVGIWQTIKTDRKRHMHMLKEAFTRSSID
jgi:hypothetical protein